MAISEQEIISQTAAKSPPSLTIPSPITAISRAIAPVVQACVLWYLRAVVEQQNQINQQMEARLEVLEKLQSDMLAARAREEAEP